MEGFGGIAMGILLGMAIGLDSGKKKFKKQREKAIKDKAISIVSADGRKLSIEQLVDLLKKKEKPWLARY